MVGDWNDLDASVEVAASLNEIGLLSRASFPAEIRWSFVTIDDAPCVLTAKGPREPGDLGGTITLWARVGARGDAAREIRLLTAVARRLKMLHGVDFAPLGDRSVLVK